MDLANDPSHCGSCGNTCTTPTGGSAVCVGGQCETVCPPGVQLCGNACVVETMDRANCGACGNACAATDVCRLGTCVPLASTIVASGLTLPSPIFSTFGIVGTADLVVDATNVYFVDAAGVHFVPKSGGTVKDIAPATGKPIRVAVDDTYVYWSENLAASIMRAPKDGTGMPSLVADASEPQGLVVTGGTVYWVSSSTTDFNIYAAPAGGGTASTFKTITNAVTGGLLYNGLQEIRTDGTNLYVVATVGPFAVPIAGGATTSLANGSTFTVGAVAARSGEYCGFSSGVGGSGFTCESGGVFFPFMSEEFLPDDTAVTLPECGIAYGRRTVSTTTTMGTFLVTNLGMQVGGPQYELLADGPVSMTNDGTTLYFIDTSGNIRGLPIP
jgi:hypothetical protein